MKTREKKVWDMYVATKNVLRFSVGTFLIMLVWPLVTVYAGGLWAGIFSLLGASVAHGIYYFRMKKRMGAENPFDWCYGIAGSPTYKRDKEFYEKVSEYMQRITPEYKPQIVILLSYIVVVIPLLLRPIEIIGVADAAGVALIYFFFVAIGHVMFYRIVMARHAKNPNKISRFFGVSEKEWKIDIKPAPRPPSVTGLMLMFFGTGIFGLALAPASLIGKMLEVRLIFPLESITMLVTLSGGAALLGGFCLWVGLGLRKMTKEGAGGAVMLCFFPLSLGVIAFVIAPLAGQVPIPPYHAIWVFGIPIGVIYIIKRNWRKFR